MNPKEKEFLGLSIIFSAGLFMGHFSNDIYIFPILVIALGVGFYFPFKKWAS